MEISSDGTCAKGPRKLLSDEAGKIFGSPNVGSEDRNDVKNDISAASREDNARVWKSAEKQGVTEEADYIQTSGVYLSILKITEDFSYSCPSSSSTEKETQWYTGKTDGVNEEIQ
jgi:hypothetical protein